MSRFGRPGLLGTVARTAVITGTVRATSGAITRGANNRQAQEEQRAYEAAQVVQVDAARQAPPIAPAPAAQPDLVASLQQLAALREAGALTEAEFDAAKSRLLAG